MPCTTCTSLRTPRTPRATPGAGVIGAARRPGRYASSWTDDSWIFDTLRLDRLLHCIPAVDVPQGWDES